MKAPLHFISAIACFMAITPFVGNAQVPSLLPLPQTMEVRKGTFTLTPKTKILTDPGSQEEARWLSEAIHRSTAYNLEIATNGSSKPEGAIVLTTQNAKANLGQEGYELDVATNGVVIRAPDTAGLFYGAQTFLQLFQPEIFATKPASPDKQWVAQAVHIEDQPRFKWRGVMLDVSRHFFTKEEVKRLLDEMAAQKFNTFHWHLVDDQAWRLEIKKYPQLTQIGAWRKDIGFGLDPKSSKAYGPDGRYGGFYTQDDIREVVAYAQSRHITIVPEIEMPGHATAALSAFPDLGCFKDLGTVDIGAGVHHGIFCPANDQVYEFLGDILTEVFALFPGKYVHIGGDEVPKDNWQKCPKCQALIKEKGLKNEHELQSYFVKRMESFVSSKGRNIIGWSEIAEGGLAQNAAVMDWVGGGIEAANTGHNVVMSPTTHCYLDYYQSTNRAAEPRSIGNFISLNKVYSFEPISEKMDPKLHSHVLGLQGNLWTEYIASFSHAEYMLYPRACALAEVGWSPKASRNYDDFTRRLQIHLKRLDQSGINHHREPASTPNTPKL